jgi:hypothetical protein
MSSPEDTLEEIPEDILGGHLHLEGHPLEDTLEDTPVDTPVDTPGGHPGVPLEDTLQDPPVVNFRYISLAPSGHSYI